VGIRSAASWLFLAALAAPVAAKEPKGRYAADVDHLLATFQEKAGHFFKAKGIDWKQVSAQFRAESKKTKTDEEHLVLCSRLVARLRDGHAGIVDSKVKWPDESKGRRFTGPRVHLLTVGDRVHVRAAFGEAAEMGVEVGMEVVDLDGVPARKWLTERRSATGTATRPRRRPSTRPATSGSPTGRGRSWPSRSARGATRRRSGSRGTAGRTTRRSGRSTRRRS
jgi:hypothetical protein